MYLGSGWCDAGRGDMQKRRTKCDGKYRPYLGVVMKCLKWRLPNGCTIRDLFMRNILQL